MSANKPSIIDPDGRLREQAEAIKADFLANRWESYLKMVRWLESHPENREGADKTWVLEASEAYRDLWRHAVEVNSSCRHTGKSSPS